MQHSMKSLLNPRSVAVIGASEDQTKFGGRLYKTLLQHKYDGTVYPINPTRKSLFGIDTFPSIDATPDAPDMVVMALPRDKVKDEIEACAKRGTKAGIIITAKFSDEGPEGARLEEDIVRTAREHGMRLIGPNCLGLISPANNLVLCSSPALNVDRLIRAPIGFVSQSGALMGTLFDRSHGMGIGFSHCVSVGNQADLELADFIEFLIEDADTEVICSYVEGIKSPDRFAALARRARQAGKPWLMVKAGMTEQGSRAAYSHTASIAGSFEALRAVCQRENVVLMNDPLDMLGLARAMVRYPNSRVGKVAVITTSGGGGAISADRLTEADIPLAAFSATTRQALDEHYSAGQASNPIDIGGRKHDSTTNELCAVTSEIALADPQVDLGLVVMTTAPDVTGFTRDTLEGSMRPAAAGKPMLFVMLPGRTATAARELLIKSGVPYVDTMAEGLSIVKAWKQWSEFKARQEPARPSTGYRLQDPGPGALSEAGCKSLLAEAGIAVNRSVLVQRREDLRAAADQTGFPAVLKVVSQDIVHKSDVGGVALGLRDLAALERALETMQERISREAPLARIDGFSLQSQFDGELELILGARNDPQFGPQVLIGAGGVMVELVKDIAVLSAPVSGDEALRALRSLKVAPLLKAYRGRGELDETAVVDALVRFSWLAHDLASHHAGAPMEIEVNPLKVGIQGQGAMAVDARARIGD